MKYIWQNKQWPNFEYDSTSIQDILYRYAIASGSIAGNMHELPKDLQIDATIDLMVSEAIKTSEIEGEKLDQEEVRSSIKNQLGLSKKAELIKDPRAMGMAQLMIAVRRNYAQQLTEEELFSWHAMILPEPSHHETFEVGHWRTGEDAMQIISGPVGRENVHYIAPPSSKLKEEMERFIA